jgi:hypothetical protein
MYPAWEDYVVWIYLLPVFYGIFALTAVLIIHESRREHQHRQQQRLLRTRKFYTKSWKVPTTPHTLRGFPDRVLAFIPSLQ